MMRMWHALLALLLAEGAFASQDRDDCVEESCTTPTPLTASALMQRLSTSRSLQSHQRRKAHVAHTGSVNLLLNEMNEFVSSKGESGLDPDEIEHIHGIRSLIDETVLPTIMESVEQNRMELDGLYQDILACSEKANEIGNVTVSKEYTKTQSKEFFKVCAHLEEEIIVKQKQACETLNRSRITVYGKGENAPPAIKQPDEAWIAYLEEMDEYFCGRVHVFDEFWEECDHWTENLTRTHAECTTLQKNLEESECTWQKTMLTTCETFDSCWTERVRKYQDRKKAIMEVQESRTDEYIGAAKVICLWSAWIYEGMPCTVNKTRVKECHEYPPNLTNITIEFPLPPNPPDCKVETVDADVCSDAWLNDEYGGMGLSHEHLEMLRATCEPCPKITSTSAPKEIATVNLMNMEHAGGDAYMKSEGGSGCDSWVESPLADVVSVMVAPARSASVVTKVSITTASNNTYEVELDNGMISSEDDEIGTEMYTSGEKIYASFSSGQLVFSKVETNSVSKIIGSIDLEDGEVSGYAKVTLCAMKGVGLHTTFVHQNP